MTAVGTMMFVAGTLGWFVHAAAGVTLPSRPLILVASGETHARLEACECPDAPGGGLPHRATVIKRLRDSAEIVLVDAGGFAGGGLYDTESQGRERDSLRTLAVLRGMGRIGYDAVLVGDDDLQYGARWLIEVADQNRVPLVCTNCRGPDGERLFDEFRIVERGGLRIAIAGVTTDERFFETDSSVSILDPVTSLRAIWDTLLRQSDIQVVLSHLGEELTVELAAELPGADVLVNAHRKRSTTAVVGTGAVSVLNFAFQGNALSYIRLRDSSGGAASAGWIPVEKGVPPDSAVAAAVGRFSEDSGLTVYDLYIMSRCPHGLAALREFLAFADRFPSVEWHVWFVGDVGPDGRLESLHGPEEVADEQLWLAVRALYGGTQWKEFLRCKAAETGSTAEIAAALGLDVGALEAWARAGGERVLAMHYRRSMRLGVDASPTLISGGNVFTGEISLERLAWKECRRRDNISDYCDSLPPCLENADCQAPGRVGACVGQGRSRTCEFREDARFTFTVVSADSVPGPDEYSMIATTRELFPAAKIERVKYNSRRGRKLVEKLGAEGLPLYLFGPAVEEAANFGRVKDGLVRVRSYYTFKPGLIRRSFFPQRPRQCGTTTVFLDPLAPFASEVLGLVLETAAAAPILPVTYPHLAASRESPEDRLRGEESHRWLLLSAFWPSAFRAYLAAYSRRPAPSDWMLNLPQEVDPTEMTRALSADTVLRARHEILLQELDIRSPLVVLLDNQQTVRAASVQELTAILERRMNASSGNRHSTGVHNREMLGVRVGK